MEQLLALARHHLCHGDARPTTDNACDVLLANLLLEHALALGLRGNRRFLVRELLLELRHLAVFQLRSAREVLGTLRRLHLAAQFVHLLLDGTHAQDRLGFTLPFCLEFRFLGVELLLLRNKSGELFFRCLVRLLFQSLLLDVELEDLAPNLVKRCGHGLDLRAQLCRGLIDEVDCLIRQEAVGDVAIRERCRCDECRVADADAVMHLVAILESAQNRNRVLHARLADHDRLEAALERRVFLDVLAVLVQCRCTDAAQLAARKERLQEVARIHRALGGTRADDRMHLVDEEENLPLGLCNLVEYRLEAFLKLTAEFRARDECAHVERVERLVLQRLGHIPRYDAAGKPFDNRRLADARLADQHWVVLRAARENLDRAANLLVTSDHGVELVRARCCRQIAPVFLERLIALLRVVARDVLLAVLLNRILHGALCQAELARDALYLVAPVRDECEQEMLRRDVLVLHRLRQFLGTPEHAHHIHAHAETVRSTHARDGGKFLFEPCLEHRQVNIADLEDRREQPLRLLCKCEQHMCRGDFLMIAHCRYLLRRLDCSKRPRCVFILFHIYTLHSSFHVYVSIITDKVKKSNIIFDFLTFIFQKKLRRIFDRASYGQIIFFL